MLSSHLSKETRQVSCVKKLKKSSENLLNLVRFYSLAEYDKVGLIQRMNFHEIFSVIMGAKSKGDKKAGIFDFGTSFCSKASKKCGED